VISSGKSVPYSKRLCLPGALIAMSAGLPQLPEHMQRLATFDRHPARLKIWVYMLDEFWVVHHSYGFPAVVGRPEACSDRGNKASLVQSGAVATTILFITVYVVISANILCKADTGYIRRNCLNHHCTRLYLRLRSHIENGLSIFEGEHVSIICCYPESLTRIEQRISRSV
jgi:hypothetical protein